MGVHRSVQVSMKEDTAVTAAAKAAWPVGVSGSLFLGIPIAEAVQWATLIFLALQIGLLVPKYWNFLKRRREDK